MLKIDHLSNSYQRYRESDSLFNETELCMLVPLVSLTAARKFSAALYFVHKIQQKSLFQWDANEMHQLWQTACYFVNPEISPGQ